MVPLARRTPSPSSTAVRINVTVGLRQRVVLLVFLLPASAGVEVSGVSSRLLTKIGHRFAQPLNQLIEQGVQVRQVWFAAQPVEKAGEVPLVGHMLFGLDPDQPPQRFVSPQFGEALFDGGMPQGDAEYEDSPEHADRIIAASFSASLLERFVECFIGQDVEQLLDGFEGGTVLEFIPSEETFVEVDLHVGAPACVSWPTDTTQLIPAKFARWSKNREKNFLKPAKQLDPDAFFIACGEVNLGNPFKYSSTKGLRTTQPPSMGTTKLYTAGSA